MSPAPDARRIVAGAFREFATRLQMEAIDRARRAKAGSGFDGVVDVAAGTALSDAARLAANIASAMSAAPSGETPQ